MGNIQSSNTIKTEDTKNSLLKKMDIIAANYITTLNIDEMTNLIDREKCANIEIFTKSEFEKKFSFVDVQYLRQRQEHGVVKNRVDNAEVIVIPKKEDLRPRELTKKHRLCEGIAKYYIKLAQVYSSIVKTLNPVYASDVNEIDIFDLYNVGINDLEENDKINNNPKKFDNLCDKRIRLLFQIVDKYNEQLKEAEKEKNEDVVIDNSELTEISTQLGGDYGYQMMQPQPQQQMMQPQSQQQMMQPQPQMMQPQPQSQMMPPQPQSQMMPPQSLSQPQMMQPQPQSQMMPQQPQQQMMPPQSQMMQPQSQQQMMPSQPQSQQQMMQPLSQQQMMQPQSQQQMMQPQEEQYMEQPQEEQYMEQPQEEQYMEQPQEQSQEEQYMEQPQMTQSQEEQHDKNIASPIDLASLNNLNNDDESVELDEGKPGICKINENMSSLYEEVGISELEELFKDKYDYENSKYVMSDSSKSKYIELVKKFQETFSGKELNKSILSKITGLFSFDNNEELEAKSFKDIKLIDFNKELDSCKREVNFDYESDETKLLFIKYAEHLKNMLSNTREFYKQLKYNLKKLFEFIEDTKTGEVYPMVHRNLTEVKLTSIAETTRVIIAELYLTCNKDFTKGLELYKQIIYTQLLNRDLNRIDNLEKDMENTVIEEEQQPDELVVEEEEQQPDEVVEEQEEQQPDELVVEEEEQAPDEVVVEEQEQVPDEVVVEEQEQQPQEVVEEEQEQQPQEVVVEEQEQQQPEEVEEKQAEVVEEDPQMDSSSINNTNSNTESLDSLKISTLDEPENKEKQN